VPSAAGAASQERVIHNFAGGTDGAHPTGRLTSNGKGGFYGMTPQGGDPTACGNQGCGVVYELTPPRPGGKAWAERIIYRFTGGTDGAAPLAGLLRDRTGALYGTTSEGGGGKCYSYQSASTSISHRHYFIKGAEVGCGTVFKLTPPAKGSSVWSETVLYRFTGSEGRFPPSTLLMDKTGALYGVTREGGNGQCGYFSSQIPLALQYQTGCGTIFKLTPPAVGQTVWTETPLHTFQGKSDGALPERRLTVSSNGSFYGVTPGLPNGTRGVYGGSTGNGTAFLLAPPRAGQTSWNLSTIFTFGRHHRQRSSRAGGVFPDTGLFLDQEGNAYGAAQGGPSAAQFGGVFELSPPAGGVGEWTARDLYDFNYNIGPPPSNPAGLTPTAITADEATGGFYGTTLSGGDDKCGCGVVFELIPPGPGMEVWSEVVLHQFHGRDGSSPQAPLAIDTAGDLFGTTQGGGSHGLGVVFEVTP
jgi:uncharacterized repeat protein (TIGR03803 family)